MCVFFYFEGLHPAHYIGGAKGIRDRNQQLDLVPPIMAHTWGKKGPPFLSVSYDLRSKFQQVAQEMLQLGAGLSVASMEILIGGLCRGGDALKAAEVFAEFLVDAVVPEGFDCLDLVESLCHVGRVDKAVEVVGLVLERNRASCLSVPAGVTVLDCLMKAGKLDDVCRLMGRMVGEGIVPDTISCNCILEALCEAGRTSDANKLRILAKEKGFQADGVTYSMLVQGFGRQGRVTEGEAVLDEMLDLGFIPNIVAYNRLLDSLHVRRSLQ